MTKKEKEEMRAATSAYRKKVRELPCYEEVSAKMRAELSAARAIEEARAASKMTQAQIAERMGTTQSCVSRILKGRNLSFNNVQRFFEACGGELVITFRPKQVN
jgi:DNA-binding transcriptional regulator YiaG